MPPKTIGILGGAGPLAGAAMLERVLRYCQTLYGCQKDADFPKIVLLSYPFSEMLACDLDAAQVKAELKVALNDLRRNGAEVLCIACNTLHAFLDGDEAQDLVQLPKAIAQVLTNEVPLVLCTSTSRKSQVHKKFFPCTYLDPSSQSELDAIIDEILLGNENPDRLEKILKKQSEKAIVLGCTELSLLRLSLPEKRILDPLDIAAKQIVVQSFRR